MGRYISYVYQVIGGQSSGRGSRTAGPRLNAVDGLVKPGAIVRKVGQDDAAGGEDGGAAGAVERFVEMTVQCLARIEQIAMGEMNVIDQVGNIAIRQSRLRGNRRRGSDRRFARREPQALL